MPPMPVAVSPASNSLVASLLPPIPSTWICSLPRALQHYYLLLIAMRQWESLQLFHHLVKTTPKERSRLLGLDVGDKYVGLALSDFHNKIASPFKYHTHTHH